MPTNFKKVDGLVNSLMAAGLQSLGDDIKEVADTRSKGYRSIEAVG